MTTTLSKMQQATIPVLSVGLLSSVLVCGADKSAQLQHRLLLDPALDPWHGTNYIGTPGGFHPRVDGELYDLYPKNFVNHVHWYQNGEMELVPDYAEEYFKANQKLIDEIYQYQIDLRLAGGNETEYFHTTAENNPEIWDGMKQLYDGWNDVVMSNATENVDMTDWDVLIHLDAYDIVNFAPEFMVLPILVFCVGAVIAFLPLMGGQCKHSCNNNPHKKLEYGIGFLGTLGSAGFATGCYIITSKELIHKDTITEALDLELIDTNPLSHLDAIPNIAFIVGGSLCAIAFVLWIYVMVSCKSPKQPQVADFGNNV